eukprot:g26153.t1
MGSSSDPDCSVAKSSHLGQRRSMGSKPRGGSNLLLSLASGRPHRNTPPSCNAHISSSFQARSPPCEPPILPNRQVLFVGTEIRDIDIPISGKVLVRTPTVVTLKFPS